MADLLELESDNPFRPRSYRNAARALEGLGDDLGGLIASGKLAAVEGIGAKTAAQIVELRESGTSERLEELLEAVPEGVRDMLAVPGLGPKKVRALWKELDLDSLDALEAACKAGEVSKLSGFGKKTELTIIERIDYLRSAAERTLFAAAEGVVATILAHLGECPSVERVEVAGSFRRRKEVVRDLDFVASTDDAPAVADWFANAPYAREVVARGSTKTSILLEGGLAVDLRVVRDEQFATTLCHFTGSKEHNVAMRARAKERGLKLNEYGLFRDDDELIECADEAAIHAALDLEFIVPEMRENQGEIEQAAASELPHLVEDGDIRGVVHLHTTWSDGKATLRQMVDAARERGYEYIGLADHSQTAFYAGGLKPADVARQHEEVDRLNDELAGEFRIFKGIESDLLPDGSLDYDDDVLEQFDFVIASLHASLGQPAAEITARVVRALENPYTTMLGHATGRLLLRREGAALDMEQVLVAAAENGVVVEINANPYRLDLDWRFGPRARELGLLTSVNPDAHVVEGIDDIRFGVGIARKAGFEAARVVNSFTADEFDAFLKNRRP